MIAMTGLEYAHARLWARFGARPTEFDWRRIEVVRDYAALLDAARAVAPFAPWLAGLTADADVHAVEALLRARLRARVEEVASWMPEAWQPAVRWCARAADLPLLAHLARHGGVPRWATTDDVFRPLFDIPQVSTWSAALPRTPLAPLVPALADPARLVAAWAREWWRLLPEAALSDTERQSFARVARVLTGHLAVFPAARGGDGWPLRRALVGKLERLFRRTPAEPAAAFVFLALVALDGERLRGELVRRVTFPRLTLAA